MAGPSTHVDHIPFEAKHDPECIEYASEISSSSGNRLIVKATVPQLVAQLTSHQFIDYEMLADFFLTYRVFTTSSQLMDLLFGRFEWAIDLFHDPSSEDSAVARAVAVRSFVVLRYWVINFFADDFVPCIQLRETFCGKIDSISQSPHADVPVFRRILDQLVKAWISQCAQYWTVPSLLEQQKDGLYPGGQFGDSPYNTANRLTTTNTNKRLPSASSPSMSSTTQSTSRRRTVLSFYNSPIDPAPQLVPSGLVEVSGPGKYIKGGIPIFNDVEVKPSLPPVIPAPESIPQKTLKPKKSLRSLRSKKSLNKLFRRNSPPPPLPTQAQLPPCTIALLQSECAKIDLLAARTIEELDWFLKYRTAAHSTSKDWEECLDNSTNDNNSLIPDSPEVTSDDDQDSRLRLHHDMEITPPLQIMRKSIQSIGSLKSSTSHQSYQSHQSYHSCESFDSYDSYDSYDSQRSGYRNDIDLRQPAVEYGGLKRQQQFTDLRRVAKLVSDNNMLSSDSTTTASIDTGSPRFSVSTLNNPLDRPPSIAPAQGTPSFSVLAAQMAEKLRNLPDDTPEDDAIAAALEKLEGTYQKKPRPPADDEDHEDPWALSRLGDTSNIGGSSRNLQIIGMSNNNGNEGHVYDGGSDLNSQLYNDAFEHNIEVLNISTNDQKEPESNFASQATESDFSITGQVGTQSTRRTSHIPEDDSDLEMSNYHTPFILSYSAKEIAEQLTLIERDAVSLVDWKELIELNWPGTNLTPVHSWVSLILQNSSRSGVEMVISRFNLMVNWVKSQILLTWDYDERVRTISTFIQIAYESANTYHNYASMMQIVLALGSSNIEKLKLTWKGVPDDDLHKLRLLQDLVSPLKNFANLREEIRRAINQLDHGCVPFVGMYLSDLTANAQQPTEHDGKINYAKFTTAASIVKSLLHCIERGSRYKIIPNEGLLAKCLYIHCLTAEEMDRCLPHCMTI
uniref:ARAD1D36388p n=1 Tax=Blastobotrys adeninivorans TaxID=409370 RepID=A0A060TBN1_BLAAD